MKRKGAWMLRNCWNWDCGEETNFWDIIKTEYSPTTDYSKKVRKYIEKSNAKFDIALIPKSRMINEGYEVYTAAHAGYKVKGDVMSRDSFMRMIDNYSKDYDFWGCVDKETGIMQAYSIVKKCGSYILFESSKANPEFLPKYYPMYGLYDARNKYYLAHHNIKYVDSGSRTITEHSNVQNFLIEKFGFRKSYSNMRIYYIPILEWAVKFLYPFRHLIIRPKSVRNVLRFEEISRKCNYV